MLIIDQNLVFEGEPDAPIPMNAHGPMPCESIAGWMKLLIDTGLMAMFSKVSSSLSLVRGPGRIPAFDPLQRTSRFLCAGSCGSSCLN
jgi:hypothetical protein